MLAIVKFHRGSGNCYDEEYRLFRGEYKEDIEENIEKYAKKYYFGWSIYVEFIDHFDEVNSYGICGHWS